MIKLLIELLEFLRSCAPLLVSVAVLSILCILLSKSIKKYSTAYYIVFAIPFFLVAIPLVAQSMGFEMQGLTRIPFLGEILRDYIHMGTFGHPLLIIIMYMGALSPRIWGIKQLMSIRKELSIISGSAVFTHSLIRITNNLPGALNFFTDNEGYLANTKVVSEAGAGISSFSFVLGIIMLVIFIPLWVTSFNSIHKRMGQVKWKKLQRWSYVLYSTLFIHAIGIQIGGIMNPRGGQAPKQAVEVVIPAEKPMQGENPGVSKTESNVSTKQIVKPENKRMPSKGFADIQVSTRTKQYIHLFSLILIYGSYLYFRLRKARKRPKYSLQN